jgi:hypothetical protein
MRRRRVPIDRGRTEPAHRREHEVALAASYRGGSIAFDELVAVGREGLVKAARSFDPDAGAKLSTWAGIKIESEIATLRRGESGWFTGSPRKKILRPRRGQLQQRALLRMDQLGATWERRRHQRDLEQRAKDRNSHFRSMP